MASFLLRGCCLSGFGNRQFLLVFASDWLNVTVFFCFLFVRRGRVYFGVMSLVRGARDGEQTTAVTERHGRDGDGDGTHCGILLGLKNNDHGGT